MFSLFVYKKCFEAEKTMAAKIVTQSQTLSSHSKFSTKLLLLHHPQFLRVLQSLPLAKKKKRKQKTIRASLLHEPIIISQQLLLISPISQIAAETQGHSLASYYTSLGLFVISVPGLWSLIKRSVKSKIVKKTFIDEEGK